MVNNILSTVQSIFSGFFSFIQEHIGIISLPTPHYNWLVILFFIFAIFIVGVSLGRSRMLLAMLSLYGAYFLESHFMYFADVQSNFKTIPDYWLHLALFLIFYLITFAILNLSVLKYKLGLQEASIISVAVIAIFELGFLASIVFSYASAAISQYIPALVLDIFGTKNAQFWWALSPLVAVLIFRRKKEPPGI
jgi:hypothetical protein